MLCLLLILSLYSIQNYYPLQTRTLQGFESSCPLLKKDFGKNYCPCPLLKKQLPQKCSSCLLLKKQIKNKYFSRLLFLTTTTSRSIVIEMQGHNALISDGSMMLLKYKLNNVCDANHRPANGAQITEQFLYTTIYSSCQYRNADILFFQVVENS